MLAGLTVITDNLDYLLWGRAAAGQPGGVIERESPIHVSNVMLFNPATGKGDRIKTKVLENGRKIRVFRSGDEAVDA